MLSFLATIIFSIALSQAENEREFSLSGIYSSALHSRLSVDTISSPLFNESNSRVNPPEEYIDLFEGSTEYIQHQIDDMESSVECSNKSTYED